VNAFNDPLEALQNFKISLYDLVILDIKMPTMNGLSVYQEIKKLDEKVRICFLTAGDLKDEEFAKKAFSTLNREDCYIQKPVTNEELVKQVKKAARITSSSR
jgi:two-component SAPR family response regulator